MCGILAIVRPVNTPVTLPQRTIDTMRDTLAHRGPDDAGTWIGAEHGSPHAALAHRRLAVIDPSPEGRQPMATPDGRFVLVYNGELYNDAEVRAQLEAEGVVFGTRCDTETVLWALATWGARAAERLRGMYAFCALDTRHHRLLVARDPLGVKPLYCHRRLEGGSPELVFASEPTAILAHPDISARPDLQGVSAYLTSIRPVTGRRTVFEGVEALLPGEWRVYDLTAGGGVFHEEQNAGFVRPGAAGAGACRDVLGDSVRAHLRSDVGLCALLSGGLDSSAICRLIGEAVGGGSLRTFCAGAGGETGSEDLPVAARTALHLGTAHTSVGVERADFEAWWPELVRRTGVPMSTPNEVAIHLVARTLRADGHVVALSGEGADELLGGYEQPIRAALAYEAACQAGRADGGAVSPGRFHVESNQWVPMSGKSAVLNADVVGAIEGDRLLLEASESAFGSVAGDGSDPVAAHLRYHRRVNLANLLRRLDTATMHAGVEGRTPFADGVFAGWAEGLASGVRVRAEGEGLRTKAPLRDAFAGDLPAEVVERPKASFPLPFAGWLDGGGEVLRRSGLSRALFTEAAIETVAAQPAAVWNLAWPMMNVALWGERWWG